MKLAARTFCARACNALLLLLFLPFFFAPAYSKDLVGQSERQYPYPRTGVVLGQGWDSRLNRPTPGVCIDFQKEIVPGHDTTTRFEKVASRTELLKEMKLSLKAGYSGSFSASAAVNFAKSSSFESDQQKLLARVAIRTGSEFAAPYERVTHADSYNAYVSDLRRAQLDALTGSVSNSVSNNEVVSSPQLGDKLPSTKIFSPSAPVSNVETNVELIPISVNRKFNKYLHPENQYGENLSAAERKKINDGRKTFRRLCGDSFISHIERGAELNALLDFSAVSQEERESLSIKFSAGGFGASASGSRTVSESLKEKFENIKVDVLQTGGALAPTPTSIEQFLSTVQSFATGVENMSGLPNGFQISTRGYETIDPLYPVDDFSVDRLNLAYLARGIFSDLAEQYEDVILDLEADEADGSLLTLPTTRAKISDCLGEDRDDNDNCDALLSRPLRDKFVIRKPLSFDFAQVDENAANKNDVIDTVKRTLPAPADNQEYNIFCGSLVKEHGYYEYEPYAENAIWPLGEAGSEERMSRQALLEECLEAENMHPWQEETVKERYRFALFVVQALEEKIEGCIGSDSGNMQAEEDCIDNGLTRILEKAIAEGYDLPLEIGVSSAGAQINVPKSYRESPYIFPIVSAMELEALISAENSDLIEQIAGAISANSEGPTYFSPLLNNLEEMKIFDESIFGYLELYEKMDEVEASVQQGIHQDIDSALRDIVTDDELVGALNESKVINDEYSIRDYCETELVEDVEILNCISEKLREKIDGESLKLPAILRVSENSFDSTKNAFCGVSPVGMLMSNCLSSVEAARNRAKMIEQAFDSLKEAELIPDTEEGVLVLTLGNEKEVITNTSDIKTVLGGLGIDTVDLGKFETEAVEAASVKNCAGGFSEDSDIRAYECLFNIALRMQAQIPMRHEAFDESSDYNDINSRIAEANGDLNSRRAQLQHDAYDMGKLIFENRLVPLFDLICTERGLSAFCTSRATYALDWASYGPGWAGALDAPICRHWKIDRSTWWVFRRTEREYRPVERIDRGPLQQSCVSGTRMSASTFLLR